MRQFLFNTSATMKPHNNKNWWIDGGIITEKRIEAENLKEALARFAELVGEKHYITISKTALKNKSPMYIDTKSGDVKQVGFVITGKSEFQKDSGEWSTQYIDLWVEILTITDTEF